MGRNCATVTGLDARSRGRVAVSENEKLKGRLEETIAANCVLVDQVNRLVAGDISPDQFKRWWVDGDKIVGAA